MRRIIIAISIICLASASRAQWKKIADFVGSDGSFQNPELITCVYFLDLPGPPRIGYVGTFSELHKTTDGGKTWHSVWDSGGAYGGYFVSNICFKDSLTGWLTAFNEFGLIGTGVFRTTDGGDHWSKLALPDQEYISIDYCSTSGLLYLSGRQDSFTRISKDLGNTWSDTFKYLTGKFCFWNAQRGIARAEKFPEREGVFLSTTDGGITWYTIPWPVNSGGSELLPIEGTSTCFESDDNNGIVIRRSDDYGRTWRILKNFGPHKDSSGNPLPPPVPPIGTGIIRGDFTRLYIQTDSGMYVSVDSGFTWKNDGGPPDKPYDTYPIFYAAKGVTIAGALGSDQVAIGGGLWEVVAASKRRKRVPDEPR